MQLNLCFYVFYYVYIEVQNKVNCITAIYFAKLPWVLPFRKSIRVCSTYMYVGTVVKVVERKVGSYL